MLGRERVVLRFFFFARHQQLRARVSAKAPLLIVSGTLVLVLVRSLFPPDG